MKIIRIKTLHVLSLAICFTLFACDTSRMLYKSSDSRRDYWKVKAVTLNHCGCTDLFVDNYVNGRRDFQIMYTGDGGARKYFYKYSEQSKVIDMVMYDASTERYEIPFDSLDTKIFERIKTIIETPNAVPYKMKWVGYKGYVRSKFRIN
ncbi:hypothetical protein WBG78_20340 [Chryseolinea sp. T2]|uniref:hypothetical protein n=1 Tax=Chryseolinea sp. T2 TaxID=3129255 RepID=UPI003077DAC9